MLSFSNQIRSMNKITKHCFWTEIVKIEHDVLHEDSDTEEEEKLLDDKRVITMMIFLILKRLNEDSRKNFKK